jgi:hypothetical protein
MIPKEGQHVKCILRTGAIAEGIVEEWFNNHVQLKSLDGESILIITHPAEDIMLIKIILGQPKTQAEEVADKIRAKGALEQKFEEVRQSHDPNNADDRKTLAQLKIELVEQERKIVSEKLKDHTATQIPKVTRYHYPGNMYGHSRSSKKSSAE